MSDALAAVYDELLLQHIREAHNYGLVEASVPTVEISNPMCGDTLRLQLDWQGDLLTQARFECECCGIAMGNASLMTLMLAGLSRKRVRQRAGQALAVLQGAALPQDLSDDSDDDARLQGWHLLAGVARQLPARLTCASLGWQAVAAGLANDLAPVAQEIRRA